MIIMEKEVIRTRKLNKTFKLKQKEAGMLGSIKALIRTKTKKIVAVNNISLSINEGEMVAFIGPNGAGKSTTIKMLIGILYPSSGDIKVLGMTPWKERKKLAYKVGSVFGQKPQLWYHLPAIDTFNLLGKIYSIEKKEYEKRLKELVELFEIQDIINTPVRKLSLGQRMKCELVGALINKPEVLLLDEPTIGLDIIAKQKIRELIRELNEKEKITVLLTSHDTQDIERLCNRAIIINNGRIVYDGKISELNKRYLNNKIIDVKFKSQFKGIEIKGAKIIKQGKYHAVFEINTKKIKIKDFIDEIIEKYEILDINISGTPIEEVITKIYKEK